MGGSHRDEGGVLAIIDHDPRNWRDNPQSATAVLQYGVDGTVNLSPVLLYGSAGSLYGARGLLYGGAGIGNFCRRRAASRE